MMDFPVIAMINIQEFIQLLILEHNLVHTQTEGLTLADTFIQPQPSGNCMNWVLGHLLDYQITILSLLGEESPIEETRLEKYRTGSEPITGPGPGVLSLEELLSGHDRLHTVIVARLEKMEDADFSPRGRLG